MYFRLLIPKYTTHLSRAVPGSKVFFLGFLLWAASILLLAVSYFLQLSALADENSMAC
jgi:hypothetical protein